ncbi:MAG TPA: aldehyde dehydrogenase family protein, partial [Acidimicrobiales bacterium]|nr:aldehyde dehydrogenase family protein [Acidimicrobiales bacterium]
MAQTEAMDAATNRAPYFLWIGGDRVEGSGGTYEVVNPATEETVGLAPEATADDARQAAAAAAEAFPAWSQTTPEERAGLLDRAADLLEQRLPELIPLVQAETGSTVQMARTAQVPGAVVRLRRYARGALESREIPLAPAPNLGAGPSSTGGGLVNAMAVRLPVGVVACITSYNVPMTNVMGKIGPALAMGNTVVIKPAHQDPLGIIRMVEAFHDAGFPPGVVNLVVGSTPESAEALVAAPQTDMISFTGSTAIGLRIGEFAARGMKRVLFELGGKGASLVFEDADIDAAARGTASTFAFHAGQICTAPTRLLAQRRAYDQVVEKLAQIATVLKVGDPLDPDTVVGPVISAAQRDRIEAYVRSGVDDGGTLVAGGTRPDIERGFFCPPTLIAGCRNDMPVAREEIFGPVVVAIPFDDEDEGIAMANDSDYGLYDYVWTGDTAKGLRVSQRLRAGNVGLNTLARNPETPFGGFKKSGIGRDGGSFALHAYSELQS